MTAPGGWRAMRSSGDDDKRRNRVKPTGDREQCPADLDVLFLPGGLEGTVAAMDDPEIVDFLAKSSAANRD